MTLEEQLLATLGPEYTLRRELGGGGMARVFLVDDARLGRPVVVKVLAPHLAAGINAERFEREIRVLASLQQANIVPLLNAGEADGLPYFTMPYVDGESLRARLTAGPRLPLRECVSILRDVGRALSYAHAHGVVHRDIKPDNILLSHGTAEVTDFGIAKALAASRVVEPDDTLTQAGVSIGTAAYMAPEQVAADPGIDHRADIYSLGVVAYEMLAGHPPFSGTAPAIMAAHVSTAPPPITNRPDLSSKLAGVVMKCLAKNPADRYPSVDALLADIERRDPTPTRQLVRRAVAVGGVLLAIAAAAWLGSAGMRARHWARAEAIPQIKAYLAVAKTDSAWLLGRRVDELLPGDSTMAALWPRFSRKRVLHSIPEGARIYRASFDDSTHWILLGTTPTDSIRVPYDFNTYGLVRLEKAGYLTTRGMLGYAARTFVLDSIGAPDSDMVRFSPASMDVFLVGLEGQPSLDLGEFLMDRREVTNRQFKAFVDAGGYAKPEYWPTPIESNGKPLPWAAAMAQFKDKTGQPGPATWEAGTYPNGQGDYPVGGVSWYEAAAYAKFAGKSLPTVYHWARAADIIAAKYVVPHSNLSGSGPLPVTATRGMSPYGLYDMAGNVREWCENPAGGDERYILGGGWSDPSYGFTDGYAQPAMDRSAINGIRLAKYPEDDSALAKARSTVVKAFRDYTREKPVSDAVFEGYRHLFDYDRRLLNARVDSRDTTADDWDIERVSFDAAYGNERMMAYLYLPKHRKSPLQSVVYFPGSGVLNLTNSVDRRDMVPSFVVKSGRAFVMPILKSTYERHDSLHSDLPDNSIFWRQHVVMWDQDMRRTLDYLATRPDMDTTRIAYFGYSWGSNMAPINLAVEPRFRTAILYVAGLTMERGGPETDPFNFLPHVTVPVLMLNGKYDFFFPLEPAQKPFFQALGTPSAEKKWVLYEGGHDVPRTELISESLAWLDKYLGPVH